MKLKHFIFFIIAIIVSQNLTADFFNQRNYIIGDKAALMGGAYTALSEDISGAYYNPAGLANIENSLISISGSVYNYQHYSRDNEYTTLKLENFSVCPTTLGYAYAGKYVTVSFSIFQMDNFDFSALNVSKNNITEKVDLKTKTYLIGPSFAIKINNSLSIGTSIFYHYYKAEMDSSAEEPDSIYLNQNQVVSGGVVPEIGIKYKHKNYLQIGLTYMAETYGLHGENIYTHYYYEQPATIVSGSGENDVEMKLPHKLNFGIAFGNEKSILVSFDSIYYFPLEIDDPHGINHTSEEDYIRKEKAHFDFSLGSSFYINERISLKSGIFTNTSSAAEEDKGDKIDMYGASIGCDFSKGDVVTTIGLTGMYGKSENENELNETIKWERYSFGFLFGGTKPF